MPIRTSPSYQAVPVGQSATKQEQADSANGSATHLAQNHKRVVVALDDSPHSEYALEFALKHLINLEHDTVTLITVPIYHSNWMEPIAVGLSMEGIASPFTPLTVAYNTIAAQEDTSKRVTSLVEGAEIHGADLLAKGRSVLYDYFKTAFPQLSEAPKHRRICDTFVLTACTDPRDAIVDFVHDHKADLLVLGSRGLGALKRAFLGSVSDYCVHHTNCPTVCVKMP